MRKAQKPRKTTRSQGVGGDQNIIKGKVTGGIVQQGRNARIVFNPSTGVNIQELTALFDVVYRHIESRPGDPNVGKEELIETTQKIEEEAAKGGQANPSKLERWMKNLNEMAPDIVDVILASLSGPVTGFTAVIKKVAERARQSQT
jgi:hypothetical protein